MVSWIIPIVSQSKTDLIHKQVIRPLRHEGSHFTKWLPPWRKGRINCLWIKSVFDWLTIGRTNDLSLAFFNNYSTHRRMCLLSTLCGNVDTVHLIYIYIMLRILMADEISHNYRLRGPQGRDHPEYGFGQREKELPDSSHGLSPHPKWSLTEYDDDFICYIFKQHFVVHYMFLFFRINCYGVEAYQTPFGGFKQSGIGREL